MTLKNTLLALTLGLSLTACSGLTSRTQQIEASCAVASAANDTIAAGVRHGKVNREQQDAAISANAFIEPVCSNKVPPTMDSVKRAAFDAAIAELLVIKGEVK